MKKISLLSLICFGSLGFLCESDAVQAQWPTVENKPVVLTLGAMTGLNLTEAAKAENRALRGQSNRMGIKKSKATFHFVHTAEDAQQYVPVMNRAKPDADAPVQPNPRQPIINNDGGNPRGDRQDGGYQLNVEGTTLDVLERVLENFDNDPELVYSVLRQIKNDANMPAPIRDVLGDGADLRTKFTKVRNILSPEVVALQLGGRDNWLNDLEGLDLNDLVIADKVDHVVHLLINLVRVGQ